VHDVIKFLFCRKTNRPMLAHNLLFLVFSLFSITTNAEIIEINDISEIRNKFVELQKNYQSSDILVLFSIKDVILKPLNPEFKGTSKKNLTPLFKRLLANVKMDNFKYFDEIVITNYKHGLLDESIPLLIKEIMDNGAPVIGINGFITGNFNKIERFEVWLDQYLNKFKINFSDSYKENNDITFDKLKSFTGTYPVFYNGILNCNKLPETQVFLYFLTKVIIAVPKVIIVVSNNVDNLHRFEMEIRSYTNDIAFIGYSYTEDTEAEQVEVKDKDIIKIWTDLIDKINNVKRINVPIKLSDDPYDN